MTAATLAAIVAEMRAEAAVMRDGGNALTRDSLAKRELLGNAAVLDDWADRLAALAPAAAVVDEPRVMVGEVLRFKANPLVRHLLDNGGITMNDLAFVECTDSERSHFAQLIGYSVAGWGTLSYVTDADWDRVHAEPAAALARVEGPVALDPTDEARAAALGAALKVLDGEPPASTPAQDLAEAGLIALQEVACDMQYLMGRASKEGHETGQRLALSVRAKIEAALSGLAVAQPIGEIVRSTEFTQIIRWADHYRPTIGDKLYAAPPQAPAAQGDGKVAVAWAEDTPHGRGYSFAQELVDAGIALRSGPDGEPWQEAMDLSADELASEGERCASVLRAKGHYLSAGLLREALRRLSQPQAVGDGVLLQAASDAIAAMDAAGKAHVYTPQRFETPDYLRTQTAYFDAANKASLASFAYIRALAAANPAAANAEKE